MRGDGGGCVSANEYSCENGAQICIKDLILYLTYDAQLLVALLSGPKAVILTLKYRKRLCGSKNSL